MLGPMTPHGSSARPARDRTVFPSKLRRPHRGFTIPEVALSALILALGISTAIIALQWGYRSLDLARGTTLASQILQSEIERLRMMNWSTLNALPASETFDGATYFSGAPGIAGKFAVTRTIAPDPNRTGSVDKITVSVTWKTYDGRSHTRTFQTEYMKDGLYDYYYTLARP